MNRAAVTRIALMTSVATIAVTGYLVSVDPAPAEAAALAKFDACDDALSYLKREALKRVGPYGLDGGMQLYGGDDGLERAEDSAAVGLQAPGAASGVAPVPPEHSTTNVQEAGVDEPDVVKTDGEHIYSVVDGVLRVINAAAGEEVGRLDLAPGAGQPLPEDYPGDYPGGNAELLLDGDRLLILVRQPMVWLDTPRVMPGWASWQGSRLVSVDVSDPASPTQLAALDLDADIVSARLVDGTVRVAVRTQPALEFRWDDALAADEPELTARNREIINQSQLEDWLPSALWTSGDSEEERLLVPCERLSYPTEFSGFTTVSVLSLPIGGDLREPNGTAVLGSGDTVYASADRFYVATNGWTATVMPIDGGPGIVGDMPVGSMPAVGALVAPVQLAQRTGIHAFDITEAGPARYVGSGEVPGRLIGQYALSEWEGNLRVASTTGDTWASGEQSESRVTVLAENGGDLVEIGMVDGLGTGEQIYAVRYVGATAYVVTFEQTDPLYVIDLADPTAPTVRGELKITGYSAYLHPVGDGRVVGVGQEAKVTGQTIGAQVSLFDVSDPASPTKLAGHVVRNGWSEAEYEARAFLYWAPTGQLVIPMGTNNRAGALVLDVGPDTLTEVGWVTPSTQSAANGNGESVRRSLVIGDRLFTVWSDGVQSNDLETLDELSWIGFS